MAGAAGGLVGVMGESVVVHTGTGDHAVSAVFREPYVGYTIAGVPVDRPDPSVLFSTLDWTATGASAGDSITIRGIVYVFVAARVRDDGTEVVLRGYQ